MVQQRPQMLWGGSTGVGHSSNSESPWAMRETRKDQWINKRISETQTAEAKSCHCSAVRKARLEEEARLVPSQRFWGCHLPSRIIVKLYTAIGTGMFGNFHLHFSVFSLALFLLICAHKFLQLMQLNLSQILHAHAQCTRMCRIQVFKFYSKLQQF